MTEPVTHAPKVGIRAASPSGWEGECICGVKFFEASRSVARRVSRAHYNLAAQNVPLPLGVPAAEPVEVAPPVGPKPVATMVITESGDTIITTFVDGEPKTLDNYHPNFARIVKAIQENGDIGGLLTPTALFENLTAEVEVKDDGVYYGDWNIHSNLTATIQRYQAEGRATDGLVKFMERLMGNPSANSRDQLFTWAQARDLTIDEDGFIIAFKAVSTSMRSTSKGHAFVLVDGKVTEYEHDYIPNEVGAVVYMPREEVKDDPLHACSTGLHVGTLRYARGHAPVMLTVKIDPADCVSVPRDSNFEKMRVCRYEVLAAEDRTKVTEETLWQHEPPAEGFEDTFDALEEQDVPRKWIDRVRAKFTSGRRIRIEEVVDAE